MSTVVYIFNIEKELTLNVLFKYQFSDMIIVVNDDLALSTLQLVDCIVDAEY